MTWQIVRQILHRLWIGKILARWTGGFRLSSDERSDVHATAREAAMVYHKLHQLVLTGDEQSLILVFFMLCKDWSCLPPLFADLIILTSLLLKVTLYMDPGKVWLNTWKQLTCHYIA